MTNFTFDIWAVYTEGDDRSYGPPTHFFSDPVEADKFSKGNGYYGGDAHVAKHTAVKVGNKTYLISRQIDLDGLDKKKTDELRASAKKKLTVEEFEALLKNDDE